LQQLTSLKTVFTFGRMKDDIDIQETRRGLEASLAELRHKISVLEKACQAIQQAIDAIDGVGSSQHEMDGCGERGLPVSVAGLVARYIDALPPHAEFSTGDIVRYLEACGFKNETKLRMNISCILGRLMSDAKDFSRVKRGRFVKDMGQSEAAM